MSSTCVSKTKNRHKVSGLGEPFGRSIFGPVNIAHGYVLLEIIFSQMVMKIERIAYLRLFLGSDMETDFVFVRFGVIDMKDLFRVVA